MLLQRGLKIMLILGLDGISSCICLNCNESLVRKNLQRSKTFLNSVIKKFFTKLANLEKYGISGFDFFCVKVNVDLKFIFNGSWKGSQVFVLGIHCSQWGDFFTFREQWQL